MHSRALIVAILFFLSPLLTSCLVTRAKKPAPPAVEKPPLTSDCTASQDGHLLFAIHIDGKDVGREVRTISEEKGPIGTLRSISSHSVTRMKMGNARFETMVVRNQRTENSGRLVDCSYVSLDQVTSRTVRVAHNGSTWHRLVGSKSSVTEPSVGTPQELELAEDAVVGMNIIDQLRDVASGKTKAPKQINFYEPLLKESTTLILLGPEEGSFESDGQEIEGSWCEAKLKDSDKVSIRAFFDNKGFLWVEEYPELNETRHRLAGSLTFSMDTSELLVGLHSEAYISDPNAATRATFRLESTPERLDSLGLLSVPLNHKVKRVSKTELILEVKAGSPDGSNPPDEADLMTSRYVQPDAPEIVGAFRYLKSAGKRGKLSEKRKNNATPVIARASLIQNPKRFWSDPDKVAGLVMHYVSALLPDKRHTFSMADSITTLRRGAGDCTEHAVLFAAIMRAARIPTRLVAGMKLNPGGMWGYHMWNTYWNGETWRSIDPSTMSYRPGALYVALGRGAAQFSDVRERLADFMWSTFRQVSINLVQASNNGEELFLARPRSPDQNLRETALFNAVVLSERGDHKGAIKILDDNIPFDRSSLSVKLMRTELLVLDGRPKEALEIIKELRSQTSDTQNVNLLNEFELQCLLQMGDEKSAEEVYTRIDTELEKRGREIDRILLKAEFLFGLKRHSEAIDLLEKALETHRDSTPLLVAFSDFVSSTEQKVPKRLEKALKAARQAVEQSMMSDHRSLTVLARVYLLLGQPGKALQIVEHALILAPAERKLHNLRAQLMSAYCSEK